MLEEAGPLLVPSALFSRSRCGRANKPDQRSRGLFVDTSARLRDCGVSAERMGDSKLQDEKATLYAEHDCFVRLTKNVVPFLYSALLYVDLVNLFG